MSKRNCHNCKNLEYVDSSRYEDSDGSGYCCNGRNYRSERAEGIHLEQLNEPDYRAKSKRCCDPRAPITPSPKEQQ